MRHTIAHYLETAATLFGVSVGAIVGSSKDRRIVRARFAVAFALRRCRPDLSLVEIGRALGGRDHSTVANAVERAAAYAERNPEYAALVRQLCGEAPPPPPPAPRLLSRDEQVGLYWYQRAGGRPLAVAA